MFSIVMPVYNRGHLVERAIASVLEQTFGDFELLVVDDASTDDTVEVVRAIDDDRIDLVALEQNVGNAEARNVALRRARGTYVTFLDSDDEFLPTFLERMHRILLDAGPEVSYAWVGRYTVHDTESGEVVTGQTTWTPGSSGHSPSDPSSDAYLQALATLRGGIGYGLTVRRSCFERIGHFDAELASAVDTDLVLRLAQQFQHAYSTEPLVRVHLHRGPRVTPNTLKKAESYEQIAKKHLPNLASHPRIAAGLLYKVGWLFYAGGDRDRGRSYLVRALRRNPVHMKAWVALAIYELFGPAGKQLHKSLSNGLRRAR